MIDKDVVLRLRGQGLSLAKIGITLNVSRQRINQVLQGYHNHYEPKLKASILARDGNTCQICLAKTNLIIHHIDKNPKHNNPGNLVTLCESCHRKQHPQTHPTPNGVDKEHCNKCKTGIRRYGQLCKECNAVRHREYYRKTHPQKRTRWA